MADVRRGELVNRNTNPHVGAGRFPRPHAGEDRGCGAGMIAGAIGTGEPVAVGQPADDLNVAPKRGQRFERTGEPVIRPFPRAAPVFEVDAVGHVHKSHPSRPGRTAPRCDADPLMAERFQHRQPDRNAEAPEGSPLQKPSTPHHSGRNQRTGISSHGVPLTTAGGGTAAVGIGPGRRI